MSATGSRCPSATSGCRPIARPPSSRTRHFEGRSGSKRRFFEQHGDVPAIEGSCRWRLQSQNPVCLQAGAKLQAELEIGGIEIENRKKILATGRGRLRLT